MMTFLTMLATLAIPAPAAPCPWPGQGVAGREIYCCTTQEGQQCCSPELDEKGLPTGCDCRPQ
ncbi:hypothetical protein NHN26_10185 [Rhodovulum tesquicola]|uniref:hypothetical protein n=1 Tax=Rhodovulum tesquicola TaxID=540254 RepID=UPI0020973F3E|nr:hypothetical protein [Rhodovulum tesquicola]MCO8145593.1 hypothetical protein [Rhodovulum tesquicola]